MVKVWLAPWLWKKVPLGDIVPPDPADAVKESTTNSGE